jgi:hypothetical protein
MSEPSTPETEPETEPKPEHAPAPVEDEASSARPNERRFRLGAVIALVVIAAIVGWLVLRDNGDSGSSSSSGSTAAHSVTAAGLASFAVSAGHPVYWLGPKPGATYELKQDSGGTYVRYLPNASAVGSDSLYTTVATYPFPGAYAALTKVASDDGQRVTQIPGGGISVPSKGHPQSVHVAYPNVDYQMEVFDPTPRAAAKAVAAGRLVAVGSGSASNAPANRTPATVAALNALPKSLGHPVYWAGARNGMTYELTRSADGNVYIRYVPAGVKLGSDNPYLTVATYPYEGALESLQALADSKGLTPVKLHGGGIAVLDPAAPRNAHLAFPGEDYQVEVFSPSAPQVRRIVRRDQVVGLG